MTLGASPYPAMRLIVFRQTEPHRATTRPDLFRYALSTAPLSSIVFHALHRQACRADAKGVPLAVAGAATSRNTVWEIPREWSVAPPAGLGRSVAYVDVVGVDTEMRRAIARRPWLAVSDGRFVATMNCRLLERALAETTADAVAVMVEPLLAAYREQARVTRDGQLVGYRRLYQDSMEPIPAPADWPHHLFIKSEIANTILTQGLPGDFRVLTERFRSLGLDVAAFAIPGSLVDPGTREGLLSLGATALRGACSGPGSRRPGGWLQAAPSAHDSAISPRSRFIGPVLVGSDVRVEPGAVIAGPSILCDDSKIGAGAVVDASIVGAGGEVAADQVARRVVVTAHEVLADRHPPTREARLPAAGILTSDGPAFRRWGRLSYVTFFKRIADVVAAVAVLALFAPIIPFIALAIKASSPGPVLFKHRRQGRYGRSFYCVKFRTMRAGADKLQDKLRFISEVDGPQFKMADDPRITTVGRFLRETYLDEIPQFYNVLMGDMSVVGPRPSPEPENTLCPWWRDARLSVRPGITGLWQVCRTRTPMKDFQEWIHYDSKYVSELSCRLDLWICWQTFRKMVADFIRQF